MDATPNSSFAPRRSADSPMLAWLLACVVLVTGLSLAAAHAPPRIRLIGLFAVAFGLLTGWGVVLLAGRLQCHPAHPVAVMVAALLSIVGLIGATWETARVEEARRSKSGQDVLAARLMEEVAARTSGGATEVSGGPAWIAFRRHLSRRVRQLGLWPSPWPEVLWVAELLAAAAASVWMSNRCLALRSQVAIQETAAT
jgi:hypothetical protein